MNEAGVLGVSFAYYARCHFLPFSTPLFFLLSWVLSTLGVFKEGNCTQA